MNINSIVGKSVEEISYFEKRQRFIFLLILLPAIAGAALAYVANVAEPMYFAVYSIFSRKYYYLFSVVLFGFSSLILIMAYLQTGFKRPVKLGRDAENYRNAVEKGISKGRAEFNELATELREKIERIQDAVFSEKSISAFVNDSDRSILLDEMMERIKSEANAKILAELKIQFEEAYYQEIRDRDFLRRFDESRSRLSKELEALGFRGNLNLGLGAVTTIVGLSFLGFSVVAGIASAPKEPLEFVYHFLPRVTLVVMIELFAYFFLSLYKASLAEIKYFQNEITNIEAKQLSLLAAISYGEKEIIGNILEKLAATERNHIISKDQTTVELEKVRIETDKMSEFWKHASELFQKKA